jgi:mevalonate kinase
MSATVVTASAPGKIILFGEHAVVYHQPALAAPVMQVQAHCRVEPGTPRSGVVIHAPDIKQVYRLFHPKEASPKNNAGPPNPLTAIVQLVLNAFGRTPTDLDVSLTVSSTIPLGRGLGSGAAISTAIVLALSKALGQKVSPAQVSGWVFQVEKLHHGTPSGIDNTVIAYAQPVFFQRDQPLERLSAGRPFTLVIGDTGITSPTYKVVGDLRQRWQANPAKYDPLFAQMGAIARQARQAIEAGNLAQVGQCMQANQILLQKVGVSSPELDFLVQIAEKAGAQGAKLSGAGWGGNMIALVNPAQAERVAVALQAAGAVQTIITQVG